jgi:hypothetical protein
MSYYDYDDEIEAAVGATQLGADDDDATDAINGSYDGIMELNDDDIDVMMNAEDDMSDVENLPDADAEIARAIVDECQGLDIEGHPKAAVAVALEMLRIDNTRRTLAQQAMYKPVVTINRRMEFIEMVFTFPTAIDANLKVMFSHLEKYGQKLNDTTELATEAPMLSITIVPIASLGCYYMVAMNPVMWALQPSAVNAPINQLKVLVRCEDVGFYQADDMDMTSIEAEVRREIMAEQEALEMMEQKDEERRQRAMMSTMFTEEG